MDLKKGDIVLVPFPFTDLNSAKVRPALVIHSDNRLEDMILLAITSQHSGSHEIVLCDGDLQEGKLPLISYVRYLKITTLNLSLVRQKVASVKRSYLKKVTELLKKYL